MFDGEKYPCPCCGYYVFSFPPGFHGVCPICRWEDDLAQLRFPLMPGSANHVSLEQGQKNYAACGAAEKRNAAITRLPQPGETRDSEWRPVDVISDNVEQPASGNDYSSSYPRDTTVLYYWRNTYWRRLAS